MTDKPITMRDFEIHTLPKGVTTITRVRGAKRLLKQKLHDDFLKLYEWKDCENIVNACFQIDDGKEAKE